MGNKRKNAYRKSTSLARSKRSKKIAAKVREEEIFNQVRAIVSTMALANLLNLSSHHSKQCKTSEYSVDGSNPKRFLVSCVCGHEFLARKDSADAHMLPIPDAIAAGALCSGIGYTSIKTLFSALEIPFIAKETYRDGEERVGAKLEEAAYDCFKRNGLLEKKLAIEAGDVIEIGGETYPFIQVTVDAGWAKRSYGHSYNSNAGVAVIIGSRTKRILWMYHRIKTCVICDKERPAQEEISEQFMDSEIPEDTEEPDHHCYKNWNESSQAMEADIIVDGFRRSIDDHGLIYKYVVGDADSSVFARIQSQVVYPGRTPVEKIDCINHGVRGLNSKIYSMVNNTSFSKHDRDFMQAQINRFGKDVKAAVAYNHEHQSREESPTSAATLAEDLVNVPAHVLGSHEQCKAYFCKSLGSPSSEYDAFKSSSAGKELLSAFHRLANRSQRLIYNVTSNFAECFMSVMTKCISGKRVNYAQRGSYARRAKSAVMSFDGSAFWLPKVFPPVDEKRTPEIWKNTAQSFLKTNVRGPNRKQRFGQQKNKKPAKVDNDSYGPNAYQGHLSESEMEGAINRLVKSLQVSTQERNKLEQVTIGQAFNEKWKLERRNRLTASNAGKIYSLRPSTNNLSTLKSILYPTDLSKNENVRNGINQEPVAKRFYTFITGIEITECGLFVHLKNGLLAASPDGLLKNEEGIIEVKCINCLPALVPDRGDNFLIRKIKDDPDSQLTLRKNHKYYYQIISQLYITGRKYCDFFVYHEPKEESENITWFLERITCDDETDKLWDKMETKLIKFYVEEMAPEIADPVFQRNGSFRLPEFRQMAIDDAKSKKAKKDAEKALKIATTSTNE